MIIEPEEVCLSIPLPATKKAIKQAQTGAGVGLEQEVDGATGFFGRLNTQRGEHTMVEGIVQEQNLGRFDDDGGQRQKAALISASTTLPAALLKASTAGPMTTLAIRIRRTARIAAEKLLISISKPTGILGSKTSSIFLMHQPPSGPMIMAPKQHGDISSDDDTHGSSRADHTTAMTVNHLAARVTNQQRESSR